MVGSIGKIPPRKLLPWPASGPLLDPGFCRLPKSYLFFDSLPCVGPFLHYMNRCLKNSNPWNWNNCRNLAARAKDR